MTQQNWEENIKVHIPRLRRYARALTNDVSNADDLVQDCLERAWDKRQSWTAGTNLRAWLFTILHNLFINGLRRQKIHNEYINQSIASQDIKQHEPNTALRDLQKCMCQLKPEYREVIILAGLENLTYKEISDVTGAPIGTVMSRLSRGRQELKLLMSEVDKPKLVSVK